MGSLEQAPDVITAIGLEDLINVPVGSAPTNVQIDPRASVVVALSPTTPIIDETDGVTSTTVSSSVAIKVRRAGIPVLLYSVS